MKTWLRALGIAVVFLGLVLLSGQNGTSAEQAAQPGADGVVMVYDPPDLKAWDRAGYDYIQKYKDTLLKSLVKVSIRGPLTHEMVPEIVAIYGDNGNFTGHDGVTYRGVREISVYLNTLIDCHKVTDFRIELKVVYAKEVPAKYIIDRGDKTVLHDLYFILSCTFTLDGRLIDPLGSTNCTHVKVCQCDRDI